ncbi:hypothetical protein Q7P35_005193 [Cladosporium inversicolor]
MKDGNSTVLYTKETRELCTACNKSDAVASCRLCRSSLRDLKNANSASRTTSLQTDLPCQQNVFTALRLTCRVSWISGLVAAQNAPDTIAAQLEAAEEEEDELTRKLLEHRSRVRRLRKQLRMKEQKEAQAQEAEASSIAKAERLEEELLAASLEPILADLTSFDPYPMDGRLLLSPEQWSNLKGVPFPILGFTSDDSGPGTPQLASTTQNVY